MYYNICSKIVFISDLISDVRINKGASKMEMNRTELESDKNKQTKQLADKIITELNSVKNVEAEIKENGNTVSILLLHYMPKGKGDSDPDFNAFELILESDGISAVDTQTEDNFVEDYNFGKTIDPAYCGIVPLDNYEYMSELKSVLRIIEKYKRPVNID